MPVGIGVQAEVAVAEFFPVTQQVVGLTVNANAQVLLATPEGQTDERMAYSDFLVWISSANGAVLESAADGLRLASAALGDGLSGGGASVVVVDINSLASATVEDTDELMIWDVSGGVLRKVTRADIVGGITGQTDLGTVQNLASVDITSSSGQDTNIASASGTQAGVLTRDSWVKLNGIQTGATISNLGRTQTTTVCTITNSGGNDTTLQNASGSICGPVTAADYSVMISPANLQADQGLAKCDITNTRGTGVTFQLASATTAGPLSAADWQRFDSGVSISVDIITSASSVNYSISTNTGGAADTIELVGGGNAGLMSPADKTRLDGMEDSANNFVLNLQQDVTNDAFQNATISNGAVTTAKMADFVADSILGRRATTGAPENLVQTDLTLTAPEVGDVFLGWDEAGALASFSADTLAYQTSRVVSWPTHGLNASQLPLAIRFSDAGVPMQANASDTFNTHTDFVVALPDTDTVRVQAGLTYFNKPTHGLDVNTFYGLKADGTWTNDLDELNAVVRDMVAYIPDANNILLLGADYRQNFVDQGAQGDMTKAVYDVADNGIVDSSESWIEVCTSSGSITAGQLVNLEGYDGTNMRQTATVATQASQLCQGIALESVSTAQPVKVLRAGEASGDFTGATAGDTVYMGAASVPVTAEPGSGKIQPIGYVTLAGATGKFGFNTALDADSIDARIGGSSFTPQINLGSLNGNQTLDFTQTDKYLISASGNLDFSLTPPAAASHVSVVVNNEADYTVSWPAGVQGNTGVRQSTGLNNKTLWKLYWDGSTWTIDNTRPNLDVINVKDEPYYAKGDDSTNDAPAIQAAIDAAHTLQLPVYIPAGTYRLESTLTIGTANGQTIHIRGAGMDRTTLIRSNNVTFTGRAMIESDTDDPTNPADARRLRRGSIRDLTVNAQNDGALQRVDYGILLQTAEWMDFSNLSIQGAGLVNMAVDWNFSNTYTNCKFHRAPGHGFMSPLLSSVCNNNTFTGCMALSNDLVGWLIGDSTAQRFYGCIAETNKAAGVWCENVRGGSLDFYFESNAEDGVTFNTFAGGTLEGSPWVVKSDIILNGLGRATVAADYSSITLRDDLRATNPTSGLDINVHSARHSNNDTYAIMFGGCRGIHVSTYQSRYDDRGKSFLIHDCHQLADNVTIGPSGDGGAYATLADEWDFYTTVNQKKPRFSHFNIAKAQNLEPLIFEASELSMDGANGSYAASSFNYRGKPLYSLGGFTGSTSWVGTEINFGEYNQFRNMPLSLVVVWLMASNYNGSKYDTNCQLQLGNDSTMHQNSGATASVDTQLSRGALGTVGAGQLDQVTLDTDIELENGEFILLNNAGPASSAPHFAQVTQALGGLTYEFTPAASSAITNQQVYTQHFRTAYVTGYPQQQTTSDYNVQLFLRRLAGATNDFIYIHRMYLIPFGQTWPIVRTDIGQS